MRDTDADRFDRTLQAAGHLKGGELGDMASVGLGVEAQVGKMTTMGLSYTGAYDGDITSHGSLECRRQIRLLRGV